MTFTEREIALLNSITAVNKLEVLHTFLYLGIYSCVDERDEIKNLIYKLEALRHDSESPRAGKTMQYLQSISQNEPIEIVPLNQKK